MISRSGSQRTGSGNARPYSSNNPFRTAASDPSVAQYSSDRQFQEWVRANGVQSPYALNGGSHSSLSIPESIEEHEQGLQPSPRPLRAATDKYVSIFGYKRCLISEPSTPVDTEPSIETHGRVQAVQ